MRARAQSRGLALIIVLFAVALVSIVVLAYFNLAILNRKTSFSSAGEARANLVALSALDYIKGDFISEIAAGSTQEVDPTGSSVPIYVPTTNSTMLPYRMTAFISPADYTIPPNLVKWSSGTWSLWPATTAYGGNAGPIRGSSGNSTTNASLNGHFLSAALWTKPIFGTNTTFSASVVPQWVYLTRQGPVSGTTALLPTMSNPNQPGYVVGRYAYTVYDEGGLLDIAAAGYSTNTFASDPTDVGRKGSQGFADLTQLGLTAAQVDQLVGWRNASSWNSTAAYVGYLTTNAPATGFLTAATNDQAFVSRQDLIQYWFNEMGLTTTAGTNALMNLTTFSREKNAPSWGPEHDASDATSPTYWYGTNTDVSYDNGGSSYPDATWRDPSGGISYAYHTNRDAAVSNNRFFPNVRVKTAFTRLSGEHANVGEPLIKNRFDLSKLSWIQTGGTMPTGVTAQALYNYFGLIANIDSNGHVVWTYNHTYANVASVPTSNGLAADTDHIMTLDEVASLGSSTSTFTNAQAREPDFFELLQAGILRGSLGLSSGDPTQYSVDAQNNAFGGEFYRADGLYQNALPVGGALYRPMTNSPSYPPSYPVHAQPMDQIIQIGANIIDQYKGDNFPTEIILYGDHFYGIQNLPYFNSMGDAALRIAPGAIVSSADPQITSATTKYQAYVHHWLDFGLWNPHQNAMYPPSSGPTDIRVSVMEGEECPYVLHLGKIPGTTAVAGTDYMGRIFEWPGTAIANKTGYTDGPAWIGLKLAAYTNFPEACVINYTNSYTSDGNNPGSQNMNDPGGRVLTALGWQRAGIYAGWSWSPDNPYKVPLCAGYTNAATQGYNFTGWQTGTGAAPAVGADPMCAQITLPLTVYLQYEDINHAGVWHTYQELHKIYYSNNTGGGDAWMETNDPGLAGWTSLYPLNSTTTSTLTIAQAVNSTSTAKNSASLTWNGGYQTNADSTVINMLDPRSDRLNLWQLQDNGSEPKANLALMPSSTIDQVTQPSRGAPTGPHFQDPAGTSDLTTWVGDAKSWVDNFNITTTGMTDWDYHAGSANPLTSYYRDRDYIARVGDAGGWTNVVLPPDAASTEPANASPLTKGAVAQRPFHLNRPFHSVGELGYVFRDDPWKTLNLISANSADAALLDLFYIGSTNSAYITNPPPDFIAGKMNINSAAQNVISSGATTLNSLPMQALLSQALRDYDTPAGNTSTMDTNIAAASDIKNLSTNVVYFFKTNGPFVNIADLPSVYPQATLTTTTVPKPLYTGLKNPSEAVIRALADSSGTRTWNLMIDVVAQAGKFNPAATSMNNFTVEGEKHYWLHVAIDRFTGEIIDEQLEPVWE